MKKTVFLIPPPGLPVPAVKGGAVETLLTHLIEENEKQGQLNLVCVSTPDDQAAAHQYTNSRIMYLERPANDWRMYARRFLRRLLGKPYPVDTWYFPVERLVLSQQPDFVIAEGGNLLELAAICRAVGQDKAVMHLHCHAKGSAALDELYGSALVLSRNVREDYLETSRMNPEKVLLLPNCIDTQRFTPQPEEIRQTVRQRLGYSPEDFVVVFCGRITPEKGIQKLVEAFLELDDPHCKLMVVGSPFFGTKTSDPFMEELRQKAAALESRITFTGFIHNEQLPQYYAAADLACFPALWQEPAGLVAIEAMACGLPILATRSGGMPEYLEGSDAVLLPQDETLVENLKKNILLLKKSPDRRAEMSRKGQQTAQRYSRQAYYDNFVCALNHLKEES